MQELLQSAFWYKASKYRKIQRFFGAFAALCLGIALVTLIDGLIAQMRAGNNELQFLPGEQIVLSGPAALKNPLASDLIARFKPENAPFTFNLEGFFTGYWFGNGMWRGEIAAFPQAEPGQYLLNISFRGAPAQSVQTYTLLVFADFAAMQAASRSLIYRYTGLNPFLLAALFGGFGILLGSITYFYGRLFFLCLKHLGLSPVYSSQGSDIWCLAPAELVPIQGNARMILDAQGNICGEARAGQWHKGRLKLTLMDECPPPPGALVCLRHPAPDHRHAQ